MVKICFEELNNEEKCNYMKTQKEFIFSIVNFKRKIFA
jgi:hypothetical protein